ncbi:MAG TPA: hypothetical protein VMT12_05875 [Syntrophales bacterium]|nr:hypothetical protein [Syntrophales bacterium]
MQGLARASPFSFSIVILSFTILLPLRPQAFIPKKDKNEATDNGESDADGEHDNYEGYNYESENYSPYEVFVHV